MGAVKPVIWMGSSRDDLKAFPADARREAGYQLDQVQRGDDPDDWKPMRTVGQSVREIRIHEASGAFRVIYLATKPEGVYVLHCFQKKTQKTTLRDLRLAALRYAAIPR
ncbi:MAG: type II toxin-antitoxin system RelE/ParE family toxin [Gammaproteobacteria bacterium]